MRKSRRKAKSELPAQPESFGPGDDLFARHLQARSRALERAAVRLPDDKAFFAELVEKINQLDGETISYQEFGSELKTLDGAMLDRFSAKLAIGVDDVREHLDLPKLKLFG